MGKTIRISVEEYKKLIAIEQRMEVITNIAKKGKYIGIEELRNILGVKGEQDERSI